DRFVEDYEADEGWIFLPQEDGSCKALGSRRTAFSGWVLLPDTPSILHHVARTARPYCCKDSSRDPFYRDHYLLTGTNRPAERRSAVAVPLNAAAVPLNAGLCSRRQIDPVPVLILESY